MMTVVSSAKMIEYKSLNALEKAFTNTGRTKRPRIEPWGTTCVINFVSDLLLLHTTN